MAIRSCKHILVVEDDPLVSEVVVDALLGTGVKGPPQGRILDLIRATREFPSAKIVAVDLPSGLGGGGECVKADITITFTAPKVEHYLAEGAEEHPHAREGGVLVDGLAGHFVVELQAAVLLRNEYPEITERTHLVAQLHRDLAFHRIELVRDRQYLVHRDGAGKVNEKLADDFLVGLESTLEAASAEASGFFGHAIVLSAFGDYLIEEDPTNAIKLVCSTATPRWRGHACS